MPDQPKFASYTPAKDILWVKDGITITTAYVDSRFSISYDSSDGDSELRLPVNCHRSNQILAASSVGFMIYNNMNTLDSYGSLPEPRQG
jgi:hypothetical protein